MNINNKMTTVIYSYQPFSNGCQALAQGLGIKRIRHKNSGFVAGSKDVVINWGSSTLPNHLNNAGRVINPPRTISTATNKLEFLKSMRLAEVPVPEFTVSVPQVEAWLKEGYEVVVRKILNSHSGRGIEILSKMQEVPYAPLYTRYFKKQDEYRVHIINGEIIDIQRKGRSKEVPDDQVNWKVRNLDGGFIYMREGVNPPDSVKQVALKAYEASGLNFGAFDIITRGKDEKSIVLEVNTAPGLTGTTVEKYVEGFKKFLLTQPS